MKRIFSANSAQSGLVFSDFSRWIVFALIVTCSTSQAVMNPNKAARELGVPNHLMRKPLVKMLIEAKDELSGINFRVPPREIVHFPYYQEGDFDALSDEDAVLNSLFLSMFRDLPPARWLKYHNIFFGYDESLIVWGLKRRTETSQVSYTFEVEQASNEKFLIYLPTIFKNENRLRKFSILVGLARVELQTQLAKHFGGWAILRENYEKFLWVGDIYTMTLIRELISHFDGDILYNEISRLNPSQDQLAQLELRALQTTMHSEHGGPDWGHYLFNRKLGDSDELHAAFLDLVLVVMENTLAKAHADQWTELSFEKLMDRQRAGLTKWWASLTENRFRVLHESNLHKDASLENVILVESIVTGNCDAVLKSMGPGADDKVH